MKRVMVLSCLLLCTLSLIRCAQSKPTEESSQKLTKFPTPVAPAVMGSDFEKAQYVVKHYWDNYPFSDTTLISNTNVTEQGFADFLSVLPYVNIEIAHQALTDMMLKAQIDTAMYDHFIALTDRYLYDPNSPYCNYDLYITVLRQMLESPLLEEIDKMVPRYQLEMLLKNRVGTPAADFNYVLTNGKRGRLYDVHAQYTLLFFNNPDCLECRHYKEYIAASPHFSQWLTAQGGSTLLKVVSFYPDNDMELWRKTSYPKGWINGSNSTSSIDTLYYLRAIPSLYLLDKNKTVILRDARVEQVEAYLQQALQ